MTMDHTKSQQVFRHAAQIMPNGVSSNFRYWGDDETLIVKRGKGAHVWDVDGNRYIDYRLGFGPVILGHGNEAVDAHVKEAVSEGIVFALTTEREIRVADQIVKMCPSVEMVRFANSGSEATMHAIRVARGYTGRDKIIKFEGQYHGMYDYVLWSTASTDATRMGYRRSPIPVAATSGMPRALRDLVITLPFNDHEALEHMLKQRWNDVACIIVEPMLGNAGSIEPHGGFLEYVRKLCDEYGIVLIMDEVKTGFRVARGGAQEIYNVHADLTTYAKALGNGYPVAAFGGKREIMSIIGKGVSHGGTYTANAVAMAAAEKTLDIIANTDALDVVATRGKQLQKGLSDILESRGIPFTFSGHPSMFGVHFSGEVPKDFREYALTNFRLYNEILERLVEHGAMPDPDSREPWFLSAAHSEEDIAFTLDAFGKAADEVLG